MFGSKSAVGSGSTSTSDAARASSSEGEVTPPRSHNGNGRELVWFYRLLYAVNVWFRYRLTFRVPLSGSVAGQHFRGFEDVSCVRKLLKEAPPWRTNCS